MKTLFDLVQNFLDVSEDLVDILVAVYFMKQALFLVKIKQWRVHLDVNVKTILDRFRFVVFSLEEFVTARNDRKYLQLLSD